MGNNIPKSDMVFEQLQERIHLILSILQNTPELKGCIKTGDEYDLSENLTMRYEDEFRLPMLASAQISSTQFEKELQTAKIFVMGFDPISALKILNPLSLNPGLKYNEEFRAAVTVARGMLAERVRIRQAQLSGDWPEVFSCMWRVEKLLKTPLGVPSIVYASHVFPVQWYAWVIESWLYLGGVEQAEFVLNELSTRYTLEPSERLWLMAQVAYCRGYITTAITLLQDLSLHRDNPMTRALLRRTILIHKLFSCLEQCDFGEDRYQALFKTTADKFSLWSKACKYDQAVQTMIFELFCSKVGTLMRSSAQEVSALRRGYWTLRRAGPVGKPRMRSALAGLERKKVKVLKHVKHLAGMTFSLESELDRCMREMNALD